MNTKQITTNLLITFLVAALLLIGCTENNVTAQQKKPASKMKKPKTDFHTAVATGNIEAVKQHIVAGTDINLKDALGGSSPLITACLYEQQEIARLLLEAGANINFQNNDGSTPLHVAAFFCKPEIVKLLLEMKADKTIKNKYNSTAYETVAAPFAQVKTIYEQMKQMLAPIGIKIDFSYVEKTRPIIATMLK